LPSLPTLDGKDVVRALEKAGYRAVRQSGSHVVMRSADGTRSVPVPMHGVRNLGPGLTRAIVRQAGLTVDAFVELLK
jgi:predicted RNA binding protein YcfA (HicA-like mRNA interferase family)